MWGLRRYIGLKAGVPFFYGTPINGVAVMKVKRIPQNQLTAAVALLSPHIPELSASNLVDALDSYQPNDPARPQYVGKNEAARMLGVSWYTVIRWAKAGEIPGAKKFGRQWRFDPDKLLAMSDADKV